MATHTQHYTHSAVAASEPFTPEMRDRQARGKDPYAHAMEDDEDDIQARLRTGHGLPRETYEEREKKEFAKAVLDNPERLLMYAQAEDDSVAGQRLRFQRMMCPVEHEKSDAAGKTAVAGGTTTTGPRPPRRDGY